MMKERFERMTLDQLYAVRETRTACYYNGNGDLVRERPMEAQEMQKTIQEDLAATGTDY